MDPQTALLCSLNIGKDGKKQQREKVSWSENSLSMLLDWKFDARTEKLSIKIYDVTRRCISMKNKSAE